MSNVVVKPLNNLRKGFLIIGGIVWGLSVIYLYTVNFLDFGDTIKPFLEDHPVVNDYIVNLSATLFCGLVITFTWDKIEEALGLVKNEDFLHEIRGSYNGFRLIKVELAFALATKFITNCNTIRAIGTAQQDLRDNNIQKEINKYLEATIKRLGRRNQKIKYRRISNISLNEQFKEHIKTVFSKKHTAVHDIEMIFYSQFTPFYTYLIIDNKFMMLSINHPPESESFSEYCLVCENKEVIELFIKQFVNIFDRERKAKQPIKDIEGFVKSQKYDKTIYDGFESIVADINYSKNTFDHLDKYIIPELEQFKKDVKGLIDQKIEINHTISNGNLLTIFCKYINEMSKGDKYTTVTFYEFWYDIVNKGNREPDFVSANINALKNKAELSRLLIIDEDIIKKYMNAEQFDKNELFKHTRELGYFIGVRKVIKININILKEYPNNYSFKILLSSSHRELRQRFFNFAVLESSTQQGGGKILFEPSNTPEIERTKILFYTNSNPNVNKDEFERKKMQLADIERKWREQKYCDFLDFFKDIDEQFFSNPINQAKVFGSECDSQ